MVVVDEVEVVVAGEVGVAYGRWVDPESTTLISRLSTISDDVDDVEVCNSVT